MASSHFFPATSTIPAGATSDFVAGHEDWFATLPHLLGWEGPRPTGLDGIDLTVALLGQSQPPRPFLYREHTSSGQQSVRIGNWKGIRQNLGRAVKDQPPKLPIALYDLASDPAETKNVAGEHPDVIAQMERLMRELRRRTRVVGCFPDGESAVVLVGARLRHVAGTKWDSRRYLDMSHLTQDHKELVDLDRLRKMLE